MKPASPLRHLVISGCAIFVVAAGCASHHKATETGKIAPEGVAIAATALQRSVSLAYLTGGDLGIGGGFLIGAAPQKIKEHLHDEAIAAAQKAEESPTQPQLVHESTTADLNHDGFVTLDEILALVRAGLSDAEILDRLKKTNYIFQITPEQERYLTDRGVRQKVVDELRSMSNQKPPAPPAVQTS